MRQRPAADRTGFLLQRAHRRLRLAHNEALRPLQLNIAELAVAGLLADRGDLSQRQLIEIMDADKSTMVYLVDELESQGLVERRPDPTDRLGVHAGTPDVQRAECDQPDHGAPVHRKIRPTDARSHVQQRPNLERSHLLSPSH